LHTTAVLIDPKRPRLDIAHVRPQPQSESNILAVSEVLPKGMCRPMWSLNDYIVIKKLHQVGTVAGRAFLLPCAPSRVLKACAVQNQISAIIMAPQPVLPSRQMCWNDTEKVAPHGPLRKGRDGTMDTVTASPPVDPLCCVRCRATRQTCTLRAANSRKSWLS